MPALVQSVAGMQLRLGEATEARRNYETFQHVLTDANAKAEAHYHACRVALERRDLRKALLSYEKANRLDPDCWTLARLLRELGEFVPPVSADIVSHARSP